MAGVQAVEDGERAVRGRGGEAAKRWAADGITVNALNPGGIRTNLQRYIDVDELVADIARQGGNVNWKTPEQGAATSVLLAASPLVEGVTGRYFVDVAEARPHREGTRSGVMAYALDPDSAARLWTVSEELITSR